jgi:antitoxin ParD1/3/4
VIETALHALRDSEQSRSAEVAEFTQELDRRLASLDRGEWEDPEAVRAELQRKSAERRRKLA